MTREYHFKAEKLGFLAAPIKVDVSQGWTFIVNKDFPWEAIDDESIGNLVRAFFRVFFRDIFGVGKDPDYLDYMTVQVRAETHYLITKHRNQIIAAKRMKGLMVKAHNSDAFNVVNSAMALEGAISATAMRANNTATQMVDNAIASLQAHRLSGQAQMRPVNSLAFDEEFRSCFEGDKLNTPLDGIGISRPPELEWANGRIQPTTAAQQPATAGVTPNAFKPTPTVPYANQEREIKVTSAAVTVNTASMKYRTVLSPTGHSIDYQIGWLSKDVNSEYLLALHLNGYDKTFVVIYDDAARVAITWTAGINPNTQKHEYDVLIINRNTVALKQYGPGLITHNQGQWAAHLSGRVIDTLARLAERYQDKNKFPFWQHNLGLYHLEQLIEQLDLAK